MNPYSFILDDLEWSFSKLQCYNRCPYNFYLEYIKRIPKVENGFAQYGSFCHDLLERYANGELMEFELLQKYKDDFHIYVTEHFPYNKYSDIRDTYYDGGYTYFESFEGFNDLKILEVESKTNFNIGKYRFVGIIDLVTKNDDGTIDIIDHKSKDLKTPRKSRWESPEERVKTELYEYIRQLYIYSIPIIEKYKKHPKNLIFNCFRKQNWIKTPFDINDYEESKQWALDTIERIYSDEKMNERYEKSYFCENICSARHYCSFTSKYIGE